MKKAKRAKGSPLMARKMMQRRKRKIPEKKISDKMTDENDMPCEEVTSNIDSAILSTDINKSTDNDEPISSKELDSNQIAQNEKQYMPAQLSNKPDQERLNIEPYYDCFVNM